MTERHVGESRGLGSVPNGSEFVVENPGREQEHLRGERLRKEHQDGATVFAESTRTGRVTKLAAKTKVMVLKAPME